jgi:hypothetical protein
MSVLAKGTGKDKTLEAKRERWRLEPLQRLAGSWTGFLLKQKFPIADDRRPYQNVVRAIANGLPEGNPPFAAEAFLQMDRIDFRDDIPLVQANAAILGDYGLGYFPHLPPPTTWTKEEFQELFPPAKLRPLFNDVMKVRSDERAIQTIQNLFLGSGAYAQAFCSQPDSFYRLATATFKPLIADKMMRMFRYYAPQLQRNAVEGASMDAMEQWSCGARLYLRESNEDGGLLVLRRGETEPLLRDLMEGRAYPAADFVLS